MTDAKLYKTLRRILHDYSGIAANEIQHEDYLADLGLDDLDALGIMRDLQSDLGAAVTPTQAAGWTTVDDILLDLKAALR
jgi:acyl carrier protein